MNSVLGLLSSGSKAVLVCDSQSDLDRLAQALASGLYLPDDFSINASVDYQPRNKKKLMLNNCPIVGCLGAICVDATARRVIQSLDGGARFYLVNTNVCDYFVYQASLRLEPFDGGVIEATSGALRLINPNFTALPDMVHLFQLPAKYEEAGGTFCSKSAAEDIRRSGATGFVAWDFSARRELLLW